MEPQRPTPWWPASWATFPATPATIEYERMDRKKGVKVKSPYLTVANRIQWFNEFCHYYLTQEGAATIPFTKETEIVEHVRGDSPATTYAVVRVTITDMFGNRAQGLALESQAGFPDYLEKAETAATGRALAFLGFGTQETLNVDFAETPRRGQTMPRIADAPADIDIPTGGFDF